MLTVMVGFGILMSVQAHRDVEFKAPGTTNSMTPALRRAYRETRYSAAGITVRIGRRSADMDRLLLSHGRQEAVFITAWNPFSRRRPDGWNRHMQLRLVRAVSRWAVLPAEGRWRRWNEAHLLVFAPDRPMARLARRYRQHAIVIVRNRQRARLEFLGRSAGLSPSGLSQRSGPAAPRTKPK